MEVGYIKDILYHVLCHWHTDHCVDDLRRFIFDWNGRVQTIENPVQCMINSELENSVSLKEQLTPKWQFVISNTISWQKSNFLLCG